ncbi:MAG: fibrillarin-like rRNA/tRNA 2'-O-methyltransferase [Candidatus Micrarchaeota archaeon]|nr:fibrillarin-like rRNA/tRNA 2'-O-methyltransferase [Candidatus Micrarchaeota archaeon]
MEAKKVFPGVYRIEGKIATKSLAPGTTVYGELTRKIGGDEYRFWDQRRSKLGAALVKGLRTMPIIPGSKVLYLGAASGTTASHVSDIVGENGVVYCVEFSARAMRDLIAVCEKRENMVPILADVRMPEAYECDVPKVDVVYEDVADREQARILLENAAKFLPAGRLAAIAIKARCVSAAANPKQVYSQVLSQLHPVFEIVEKIDLAPFEMDHLFAVLRKK